MGSGTKAIWQDEGQGFAS